MVIEFVNNIINAIFQQLFNGLDLFFKHIGSLFANLGWVVLIGLLLISMPGFGELEPLLVPFGLFYLCLFIVHLFLWPKKMPKNPLPDISKSSQTFIQRLLFYGIPLMIFFWLLVVFGLVDQVNDNFAKLSQYLSQNTSGYYDRLANLPSLTVPSTDFVIPGGVVLVVGVLAFILLIRRLLRRRKS